MNDTFYTLNIVYQLLMLLLIDPPLQSQKVNMNLTFNGYRSFTL